MTMRTSEQAARLLLQYRRPLYAYIQALVRDAHLAEDLFQEVSLVLLRRWEEFGEVRNFWALARETARRQSVAALRRLGRERFVLSAAAQDAVDRGFDAVADQADPRREALRHCVQGLPDLWRTIVRSRYWKNLPVGDVARQVERSENSVSVTLNKIRSRLADCVEQRLRTGEAP
jgi:RNA polymerase sigma-70 factor (ECF subfamily)